jgi:pimeloyl-ACP methyl ester carboxylesterase
MSQDRIGEQVAAMTPAQRQRLIAEFPQQVGNTDGVPWGMRVAANRVNIAQAIVDTKDPGRIALYRTLLGEVGNPTCIGQGVDRQILAFDPGRASLVELNGNLSTAKSFAVLVPGLNTTLEGSAANTAAANPRYALDMAPRLVAFSEDVDRTVDATGRPIPVTYIGHSYGGSIVGTAKRSA